MATLVMPPPSEKQKLFLTETHKFVGFGGARGGGKSFAVRMKAVLLCLKYPKIKCMIVRKTYPELTENHIVPLVSLLNCYAPNKKDRIASYNDSKKTMTFPNGSRIIFRYCDTPKDANRFQGTEATHHSEENMRKLTACVRGVNDFPKRIYMTANPGGEGHAWYKRLYIDRKYELGEEPDDYVFIQSLVTDNKALMDADPTYMKKLEALPPKLRKAHQENDRAVMQAYGFDIKTTTESSCVAELMKMYQELTKK